MGNSPKPRNQRKPGEKWMEIFTSEFFKTMGRGATKEELRDGIASFQFGATAVVAGYGVASASRDRELIGRLQKDIEELKGYDVRQLVPERLRLRQKQEDITNQLQRVSCLLCMGQEEAPEPDVLPLHELPDIVDIEELAWTIAEAICDR